MGVHRTCGEPNEIGLTPHGGGIERLARRTDLPLEQPAVVLGRQRARGRGLAECVSCKALGGRPRVVGDEHVGLEPYLATVPEPGLLLARLARPDDQKEP